ncbi:glycosyltransferase [Niastella koreensis]|uniref:glycosyltransferase n=1 Tax=Niastella koreensis TaxID=354356 RepID=UPI00031B1D16|nr:glycosyltransferase [Niastella koreensis]
MATIFIPAPHFPPSAMPPSQRVRLLVRHLHTLGWKPVIFTVDHYYREELADPWMLDITGDQFEKVEVGCLDQRKTRKFKIGDLGIRMFFHLFFSLLKHARKRKPALILYPVPPWYIMVMAPFIKWFSGVPYAIDYIDPWIFKVPENDRKAKMSQWVARTLEGFVVKRSSAIFAVSQGILNDLISRYPVVKSIPLVPVPYGVEPTDFLTIKVSRPENEKVILRYTGAVSSAMLPVADALFKALRLVNQQIPLQVEFTGTSYAGIGLAQPVLEPLIIENDVQSFVTENPNRVGYRTALELSMGADMQLLMGDTTQYYAASKLMGMVASGRPFFAFVHKGSFPSTFLDSLNFAGKVDFIASELNDEKTIRELADSLLNAIRRRHEFNPIDINNSSLNQHTAFAMAQTFSNTLQKIVHE